MTPKQWDDVHLYRKWRMYDSIITVGLCLLGALAGLCFALAAGVLV